MPAFPLDYEFPVHSGLPPYIWYAIHFAAMFSESLSMMGASYIFYKSFQSYRKDQLTPMRFLPLMIAIGDFSYATLHGSDHIYALAINRGPSGPICYMFSLFLWIPWNINLFASTATAWYTHYTITKKKNPNVGPYYYKMTIPVFLCAAIPPIIGVLTGATSPNGFYCDLQRWYTPYQLVLNNVTLAVLIFFYCRSFFCLRDHVSELMQMSYKKLQNPFELSISKMESVMYKLGSYLLIQIFLLAWAALYSIISFAVPDITEWSLWIDVGGMC